MIFRKQLYIPSNPLLACFSGNVAENSAVKGFVKSKQSVVHFNKKDFAEILARQGFGDFQKNKIERKNFVTIEKRLNYRPYKKVKLNNYEQS